MYKHLLSLFSLLTLCFSAYAQSVPQAFSYQAVARDGNGDLLVNEIINVRLSILDGSTTGATLYEERHNGESTNARGHFQVEVGEGSDKTGTIDGIDWLAGDRFLKVELAEGGSEDFDEVGTTQLLSVPYSLVAGLSDMANMANQATNADNATTADHASFADTALYAENGKLKNGAGTEFISFTRSGGSVGVDISGAPNSLIRMNGPSGDEQVRIFSEVTQNDAGFIRLRGGTGTVNVQMGSVSAGASDLGILAAYDANSTAKASISVNGAGDGVVAASGPNGGLKPFVMPHPRKADSEIWYCAIEGPEAAAYDRGTATLVNGEAEITFSDHFQIVINPATMTIMTSPMSADSKGLAVIEQTTTGFKVKELLGGTGSYQFHWRVDGKRKGHEDFQVIRDKKDSPFYQE